MVSQLNKIKGYYINYKQKETINTYNRNRTTRTNQSKRAEGEHTESLRLMGAEVTFKDDNDSDKKNEKQEKIKKGVGEGRGNLHKKQKNGWKDKDSKFS